MIICCTENPYFTFKGQWWRSRLSGTIWISRLTRLPRVDGICMLFYCISSKFDLWQHICSEPLSALSPCVCNERAPLALRDWMEKMENQGCGWANGHASHGWHAHTQNRISKRTQMPCYRWVLVKDVHVMVDPWHWIFFGCQGEAGPPGPAGPRGIPVSSTSSVYMTGCDFLSIQCRKQHKTGMRCISVYHEH